MQINILNLVFWAAIWSVAKISTTLQYYCIPGIFHGIYISWLSMEPGFSQFKWSLSKCFRTLPHGYIQEISIFLKVKIFIPQNSSSCIYVLAPQSYHSDCCHSWVCCTYSTSSSQLTMYTDHCQVLPWLYREGTLIRVILYYNCMIIIMCSYSNWSSTLVTIVIIL